MTPETLAAAEAEAKRFLRACAAFRLAAPMRTTTLPDGKTFKMFPNAPRESGALRRASLDLTRALATMRRP